MRINGLTLPDKVKILGETYKIIYQDKDKDESLLGAFGYCEFYAKEIHIDKKLFLDNDLGEYHENFKDLYKKGFEVLRHEMIHCFIYESGLWDNCEWAKNEELTDWLAIQFPKLNKLFSSLNIEE